MMRKTICMRGADAAELLYDDARCRRRGAAPEPVKATLFGKGGVQGLDGAAHRSRKHMLLLLCSPERARRLAATFSAELRTSASRWANREIVLYDALHPVLVRAVCRWAEVPLQNDEVSARAADIVAMFDKPASSFASHLRTRFARRRLERWAADIVKRVRTARLGVNEGSALNTIAWHADDGYKLLRPRIAAVELLNLIRPTVAVSVYIVHAMHALHRHPQWNALLAEADWGGDTLDRFVQEVRRHYPFFPAIAARVRKDFVWRGMRFPRGRRLLLDVYGTNHDERVWADPEEFRPDRFLEQRPTPYDFIPQGGADPRTGHRCPGEAIAIELMKAALRFLHRDVRYSLPPQDWTLDYSRLPALPCDRVRLRDVQFRDSRRKPLDR
ncbi:MAG TPA: cytochrome P450 [Steroidobacteraceae bacterium]|nr:cytochrome P450 [Steroidobacteraceae bacterium]